MPTAHYRGQPRQRSFLRQAFRDWFLTLNADRIKQAKLKFGVISTGCAAQMAAAQLGKVETLIGIGQYDSARMQLREGAASTIRLDLRAYDRSRHTSPDAPQVIQMDRVIVCSNVLECTCL